MKNKEIKKRLHPLPPRRLSNYPVKNEEIMKNENDTIENGSWVSVPIVESHPYATIRPYRNRLPLPTREWWRGTIIGYNNGIYTIKHTHPGKIKEYTRNQFVVRHRNTKGTKRRAIKFYL